MNRERPQRLHCPSLGILILIVASVFLILLCIASSTMASELTNLSDAGAQTYRHASGLELVLPKGWGSSAEGGVTQFIPPDRGMNADGATEAYLLVVGGLQGITRIDDPRVVPTLEQELAQLSPNLRRVAPPASFRAGERTGWAVEYEAASPTGMVVRVRAYVIVADGFSATLLAIGEKQRVVARDAELRQMACSLAVGPARRDGAVAGVWRYSRNESFVSGTATMAIVANGYLILRPDGSCEFGESSRAVGGDHNVGLDSGDDINRLRGRWSCDGKTLVIIADGGQGAMTLQYEVVGRPGSRSLRIWGPDFSRRYQESR